MLENNLYANTHEWCVCVCAANQQHMCVCSIMFVLVRRNVQRALLKTSLKKRRNKKVARATIFIFQRRVGVAVAVAALSVCLRRREE